MFYMKNNVCFLLAIAMLTCCQKNDFVPNQETTDFDRFETYQVPLPISTKTLDSDIYITVVYDSVDDAVVSANLSNEALNYYDISEAEFEDIMNGILVEESNGDPGSDTRADYYQNMKKCEKDYKKGWERTRCKICRTIEYAVACLEVVLD